MTERSYTTTNMTEARAASPDLKIHGNPGAWVCVCKAGSQSQGWMHSTKALDLGPGRGVLVQTFTQQGDNVCQALTHVPGMRLSELIEATLEE